MSGRIMTKFDAPEHSADPSGLPTLTGGSEEQKNAVAPKRIRPIQNLSRTAVAGLGWLLAQSVAVRFIGFGSQIVLAKILVPADFAGLALAGTVTALVGALVNFGVDDVLLQRQKTMNYWITPAFLTSLGLGVASMLLVLAAAPLAAMIYRAPILLWIMPIMAISMPIGALSTVPAVKIRAELNFRLLATYSTIELVVTQTLIVILALKGFGVFSFVLPGPAMAAARAITFWILAKPRLRRTRRKQLRIMGASGANVFGTRILGAAISQGDYFTLGLLAPKPVVGAYFFAFRLAIQPVQMLAGSLSGVMFPLLAQLRADPDRQREAAINASRVLAFAVMPYCFMQAAVARPLLSLVFGAKWQVSIPLVQILSIGLAFDAVSWIAGALLSARGEFRRSFIYSCIFSPVFFIVVGVGGIVASAIGVATAVSLFYMVISPVYSYVVFSRMGASFRDVGAIYLTSTVFAAVAMTLAAGLASLVPGGQLAQVAFIVAIGGGSYLGLIRAFTPATYRQLIGHLADILRRRRRGLSA
jgi:O-antigen/teichoic acid export membrane protein